MTLRSPWYNHSFCLSIKHQTLRERVCVCLCVQLAGMNHSLKLNMNSSTSIMWHFSLILVSYLSETTAGHYHDWTGYRECYNLYGPYLELAKNIFDVAANVWEAAPCTVVALCMVLMRLRMQQLIFHASMVQQWLWVCSCLWKSLKLDSWFINLASVSVWM